MILVVYAHPYPTRSRAGRALLQAIGDLPDVTVRSLYDLYPDFDIDVTAEQEALARAQLIVWLHPFYWYSVPGLMKHWFDKVLEQGWAYGEGGTALAGKRCLWAPTVVAHRQRLPASAVPPSPYAQPCSSTLSNQCFISPGTLYQ